MRRDRGRAGSSRRSARKPPTEYVIGTESDLKFAASVRKRIKQQNQRRWVIRIAILAVLVFAVAMWGEDVWYAVRTKVRNTVYGFEKTADYIKRGRDRRSGADFDENAPDWHKPEAPQHQQDW